MFLLRLTSCYRHWQASLVMLFCRSRFFFLWSYPWTKENETCPASISVLIQRFWHCNEAIPKFLLQHVMASFPGQMQQCRCCDGSLLKKGLMVIILHWVTSVVYIHTSVNKLHTFFHYLFYFNNYLVFLSHSVFCSVDIIEAWRHPCCHHLSYSWLTLNRT